MVDLTHVITPDGLKHIRSLFVEYAASLAFDLSFQDFQDELAGLPGKYSPPAGRLLLARQDGEPAGCAALRPLGGGLCEMKRLYVRPGHRGRGLGRQLARAIIAEGARIGYAKMRLDTVPTMAKAVALYRGLGFQEILPYCHNPIPGALFFELDLRGVTAY